MFSKSEFLTLSISTAKGTGEEEKKKDKMLT